MSELGYVEGRNLVIEWRFADGEYERLPGMAAELVQLKVDVIMALGPPGAIAAESDFYDSHRYRSFMDPVGAA
jgi:putative ABC transport system substrate-binding protein